MEANLFRYIWRFSRREQIAILLLIVGSLPFYWGSLDIPKRIVNEAIQGRAFRDGKTEAQLFDLSIALPKFLGGWSIHCDSLPPSRRSTSSLQTVLRASH